MYVFINRLYIAYINEYYVEFWREALNLSKAASPKITATPPQGDTQLTETLLEHTMPPQTVDSSHALCHFSIGITRVMLLVSCFFKFCRQALNLSKVEITATPLEEDTQVPATPPRTHGANEENPLYANTGSQPPAARIKDVCRNYGNREASPHNSEDEDAPEEPEPPAASTAEAEDLEDAAAEEEPPAEAPPVHLSPGAVRKRLARILTPKANGDFKVPKQVIEDFAGDEKHKLMAMFEKAGYKRD